VFLKKQVHIKRVKIKSELPLRNKRLALTERNQPEGVKMKMIERKLRSDVNWQGALKKKGVKQKALNDENV